MEFRYSKLYDISIELCESMFVWPDDLPFSKKEKHNNSICVSDIYMGLHAGTHIDAPYHFLPHGRKISDFPIERFIGKTRVLYIEDKRSIKLTELKQKNLQDVDKVLFKTDNSRRWNRSNFDPGFIGLEPEAAKYIVNSGVTLVGTDYLSIEAYKSKENYVHNTLMKHDVLILEGLNLSEVPEGDYFLVCAPLKIVGAEASPVRAFLMSVDV